VNATWIMLAQGVSTEKPALVSRHVNHSGVLFWGLDGDLNYIEWTKSTGWTNPEVMQQPVGSNLSAQLGMVAVAPDTFWVLGLDADGNIVRLTWSADTGWGGWEMIASGYAADQTLAAEMRRFYDVMLLGRTASGSGASLLYTNQGSEATSTALIPPPEDSYQHGSHVLAWVNGSVVLVAAHQSALGPPYMWEVEAYEMVGDTQRTGTLLLDNHSFQEENIVSLAAGDLDFDGNEEVIVATRAGSYYVNNTHVSVLDFSLGLR
jgi:hypothetical protein